MNDNELREMSVILKALANQAGLLQWVNCYAVGANGGGLYVSLFNDKAQFRLCAVYAERVRELPPFIRDNMPDDGDGIEIATDRTVVERKGQLRPCTPFQIARFTRGDDEKAKWIFGGVVRVAMPRQENELPADDGRVLPSGRIDPGMVALSNEQQPSPVTALLARFDTLGRDLYGAANWPDIARRNAHRISGGETDNSADLTPEQIQRLIDGMMKIKAKHQPPPSDADRVQEKFDAPTPEARGAQPTTRERVAAHSGYAG